MSIIAAKLSGLKIKQILHVVKRIKEVNGRLQLIRTTPNQTKIFVDYAHTPDALETTLKTLKEHYRIRPDVVFVAVVKETKKRGLKWRVFAKKMLKKYM